MHQSVKAFLFWLGQHLFLTSFSRRPPSISYQTTHGFRLPATQRYLSTLFVLVIIERGKCCWWETESFHNTEFRGTRKLIPILLPTLMVAPDCPCMTFFPTEWCSCTTYNGQCKTQTTDCRPGVKCHLQTVDILTEPCWHFHHWELTIYTG